MKWGKNYKRKMRSITAQSHQKSRGVRTTYLSPKYCLFIFMAESATSLFGNSAIASPLGLLSRFIKIFTLVHGKENHSTISASLVRNGSPFNLIENFSPFASS